MIRENYHYFPQPLLKVAHVGWHAPWVPIGYLDDSPHRSAPTLALQDCLPYNREQLALRPCSKEVIPRMPVIKIGLLGFGTVGQAIAQLNQPFGDDRYDIVRALVRNPKSPRTISLPLTVDPYEIIDDATIDVVVEVVGGREPARQWILRALSNGKAVVTANKELLAYHGSDLIQASYDSKTFLGYEASVGGGIPLLDAIRWHLSAAPIQHLFGVLNGTTNYLLCAMANGQPLGDALRDAQLAGFAEADPRRDLEGQDTLQKLVILMYLAFGRWVTPDSVLVKGLEEWPPTIVSRLTQANLAIRLVAMARRLPNGELEAEVRPVVVRKESPLYHLQGSQNGIGISSAAGRFWLEGPGAGGLATATSIWSDIRKSRLLNRLPDPPITSDSASVNPWILPFVDISLDPDRTLSRTEPGPVFSHPSIVYNSPDGVKLDGVSRFSYWE